MTAEKPRLVIVVPAFDEAQRIEETVTELRRVGETGTAGGFDIRIFVVDDGSRDGTGELAERAGADFVLRHGLNQGLGAALRTGLKAAREEGAELVVKFDADLQHAPEDVDRIIGPLVEGQADIVYGDRTGSIEYRMPLVRRVGNRLFTLLMRRLTGWPLRDGQPGIFAMNRSYLEVAQLPGDYNYAQQLLLDAYHKGMRFAHVPVRFRERKTGRSFISLKYPFLVLTQILLVLIGIRPLSIFLPLGGLFLLSGAAVFTVELLQFLFGNAAKPVEHVNLTLGLALFGLQTVFFGLLAHLIVSQQRGGR